MTAIFAGDLRHCASNGSVVGVNRWLPSEAFDYDWGRIHPQIGCNHIRCGSCGERVTVSRADQYARCYRCACSEYVESNCTPLGGDPDEYRGLRSLTDPPPGSWACAGHPPLPVPSTLDGVLISPERFLDVARVGFASPPFVPPETSGHAIWVSRLYWILPDALRPALGEAVSELVLDPDTTVAVRAMRFFSEQRMAKGGERLTAIARDHGARLATIADPDHPAFTVENELLAALTFRGFRRDDAGQLIDPEAHELLRQAVRAGKNPDDVIYTFARLEPEWLAANAAEIVKNGPTLLEDVLWLLGKLAPEVRDRAYRSIAELDEPTRAELYKCIDAEFNGEEHAQILAALQRRA